MLKRTFDIVLATMLLVGTSPLLLVLTVATRLDGGPAMFRQERVGKGGGRFRIHKFRTMREIGAHGQRSAAAAAVTSDTDVRITRLGRVLRATKLDELPQLLDVLAGDMSLVGPRPEVPKYVDCWPSDARERILSVRPGITDPASVAYRRESAELALVPDPESYYLDVVLPRKVGMYVAYVENHSFVGDLRILARTVRAVLSG